MSNASEPFAREVLEIHQLIEDWFNGTLPKTETALARFTSVMEPELSVVMPAGRVVDRGGLIARLFELHGWWEDSVPPGRIRIEGLRCEARSADLAVATYEEWQHYRDVVRGRVATAILRVRAGAPNGLAWLRLHETWLPAE
ncbi:MAG: hypothetical protein IPK07_10535 [Deltaproteobacteria bacterium]|nr:hypothetical protein [Deltaproteobacteria bacterium]